MNATDTTEPKPRRGCPLGTKKRLRRHLSGQRVRGLSREWEGEHMNWTIFRARCDEFLASRGLADSSAGQSTPAEA